MGRKGPARGEGKGRTIVRPGYFGLVSAWCIENDKNVTNRGAWYTNHCLVFLFCFFFKATQ